MAKGGSFLSHNKVLPGAYINFISKARALGVIGERGVVAFAYNLGWGPLGSVTTISAEDFQNNSLSLLGYSYSHSKLLPLREIFKNASSLKLFRLGGGDFATAKAEDLLITAKYPGKRGNDLFIKIISDVSTNQKTIQTFFDFKLVHQQVISKFDEIVDNDFVTFSKSESSNQNPTLPSSVSMNLTNGADTTPINNDYSEFLSTIEAHNFNILIYDGEDKTTKGLFNSFVKRLRDDEGYKVTLVLHDYTTADFEGTISVENFKELVYWVAGASAGANINESLTNKIYDGELIFSANYSSAELKIFIKSGKFALYSDGSKIRVLKDINTFTSFNTNKNSDFSNNQIIRVIDSVGNDVASIFNNNYLGKIQNDQLGRDIFKSELISYHRQLLAIRAIDNFYPTDIIITSGTEKGDVIVSLNIQPIASMDKLYMQCIIE